MNIITKNLIHLMKHRDKLDENGFSTLVNKILKPYPNIGWEYGPYPANPKIDVLSLSCGYDIKEINSLSSEFSLPIENDTWKICVGSAPKEWELYFEFQSDSGKIYKVEASNWQWDAVWNNDCLDLNIYINNLEGYLDKDINDLATIVITSEIGTLNYAKYVNSVNIKYIGDNVVNKFEMETFKQQFAKRYKNCYFYEFLVN